MHQCHLWVPVWGGIIALVNNQNCAMGGLTDVRLTSNGEDRGFAPQAQPSSFSAMPECQIFVMWLILSPVNCIT